MAKKPIVIGITGGIGSGKSTVCKHLRDKGYAVYEADARAKEVMISNPTLVHQIKENFGENAYFQEGGLNRAYISAIVFSQPEKLQLLNSLVHPATKHDFEVWLTQLPQNYPFSYVFKEAAILYESGSYKFVDKVVAVYAPKALRLERVMSRDNVPMQSVLDRMDKQWTDDEKMRLADFTIFNDGKHEVTPQIQAMLDRFDGK